ncbi:MAG: VWA domain-containing protein [Methanomicrobiales archaeon]|nr:VWA domain-containing protein [Methanomicrobiales archaeon]
MIVNRVVFLMLGLLLLIGPMSAYYADPTASTMLPSDGSKIWIIADPGQFNEYKITAYNNTPGYAGPVQNALVTITVDNPVLGTVSPASAVTDSNGQVRCTFTVNSSHPTSGTAQIRADIASSDAPADTPWHTYLTFDQKIDHNVPYSASYDYPNIGEVEGTIPFKITLYDRWGNLIDSRYENENGQPLHYLKLHINGPTPPNDCGFTDYSMTHDTTVNLNAAGTAVFTVTPATKPGWHYLLVESTGAIPQDIKSFRTYAKGVPVRMEQSFSPDSYTPGFPPTVTADGVSKFTFHYTLYDKYDNPTMDQPVLIETYASGSPTVETTLELKSLENGEVWSTYGPKSFTGLFTITGTPVNNPSEQKTKEVRFYSTAPTRLSLTANPQNMPSRDANPLIYANITAKVTDIMGNGVAGEPVTFTFHDVKNNPTAATFTTYPSFSKTATEITASATTDENGYATVRFYPGAYPTASEAGYEPTVSGECVITADWKGIQRDEPVSWKNYPYLSALVAVNPMQAKVGDNVNVSVKLVGDGWALYKYPIDVNMVIDRSGSMDWDITGHSGGTPKRITIAKDAANVFIDHMSETNDRVGLWSYSAGGTSTQGTGGMQTPFAQVRTDINALTPSGGTATREGVKKAIEDMIADPNLNPKAVRAVVVMTDGDWNNEGTPAGSGNGWPAGSHEYTSFPDVDTNNYRYYPGLGGTITDMNPINYCTTCAAGWYRTGGRCCQWKWGNCYYPDDYPATCSVREAMGRCTDGEFTEQNLSIYAKNHNIRLYFIFFAGTPDPDAVSVLTTMAEHTGGFYQRATTAAELDEAYDKIAGDLIQEAGVDTEVALDFGQLIINAAMSPPGEKIFDYVPDPVGGGDTPAIQPGSTMIDKFNKTKDGEIDEHLVPGIDLATGLPFTKVGPVIVDQSQYWNDHNSQLGFNIGTVNINETWQADFRFKVLKEGNIQIFGPNSQVCFKNGAAGDSCMHFPNLTLSAAMNPENVGVTEKIINIHDLKRVGEGEVTGTIPVTWTTTYNGAEMITVEVSYILNEGTPVRFDVLTLNPAFDLVHPQSSVLNTGNLPPGGYKIQVHAFTKDASVTKECGPFTYNTQGRAFIKLE